MFKKVTECGDSCCFRRCQHGTIAWRQVQPLVTQLPEESYNFIEEYESEEDDGTIGPVVPDDPGHIFGDETWNQEHFTYDPPPLEFDGCGSSTSFYEGLPTLLQLWELFWPPVLMRKIVRKSNRYAEAPMDNIGNTMEGA